MAGGEEAGVAGADKANAPRGLRFSVVHRQHESAGRRRSARVTAGAVGPGSAAAASAATCPGAATTPQPAARIARSFIRVQLTRSIASAATSSPINCCSELFARTAGSSRCAAKAVLARFPYVFSVRRWVLRGSASQSGPSPSSSRPIATSRVFNAGEFAATSAPSDMPTSRSSRSLSS